MTPPASPLVGMAFSVLPAQYLAFLEMKLPCDVITTDYSCGVLHFKKKKTSLIHNHLTNFFAGVLCGQVSEMWMKNAIIRQLVETFFCCRTEIRDSDLNPTVDMRPDVAVLFPGCVQSRDLGGLCARLVVEIMYAHHFTREQAEERYKKYFCEKSGGDVRNSACCRSRTCS